MRIYYNAQGAEYDALAQAISRLLGQPARYLGAPYHKHYEIGRYRLHKKGVLICPGESHAAENNQLVSQLRALGFAPANENNPAEDKGKEVTMSNINYNVTGEQRKTLVHAMSEILGEDAIYQGAPSFAYAVDGYTVSQDGAVTCPVQASREEIEQLIAALREQGFEPKNVEDLYAFTVEMPRSGFSEEAYGNLQKIIASKAALLKKAIDTDTLSVEMSADKLLFPWFTLHGLDGEADAYTRLVAAMCKMAKEQKRVTAKERKVANDKFTMRLFLIRLGFIGDEYKTARKILLRNLTGNSSWKSGHRPEPAANDNHDEAPAAPAAEAEGGAPYEE